MVLNLQLPLLAHEVKVFNLQLHITGTVPLLGHQYFARE